jgi:hypothetical protein
MISGHLTIATPETAGQFPIDANAQEVIFAGIIFNYI